MTNGSQMFGIQQRHFTVQVLKQEEIYTMCNQRWLYMSKYTACILNNEMNFVMPLMQGLKQE